jgi:ATP-binding cassette, subfamily C, bacterial CydD
MNTIEAVIARPRGWLVHTAILDLAALAAIIGQVAALAGILEPVLLENATILDVTGPAAVLVLLTVLRSTLLGAREIVGHDAAARVKAELRLEVFERLLRLGPNNLRAERTGELVTLIGDGVERLDAYVSRYLPQRVLSIAGPLLVVGYVGWLDPLSAGLLLISAPIIPLLMVAVGTYSEDHVRGQWLALGRLSAYLLDVLQGLPTLKLLWRVEAEGSRMAELSAVFRIESLRALRYAFLSSFVLELMTTGAIALVAVELGLRLLDGAIGFAATLQVLMLTPEFYRPLRELGAQRHAAMEARPVVERIQALSQAPAPEADAVVTTEIPVGPIGLEFREVTYRYPDSIEPALRGVSFRLRPGLRTALVGPSAAGKSTLAGLLLRFLEPTSGAILANGVQIDTLSVARWRDRVALVPQRPYLFDASALENLRMARPAASLDEVEYAAELAGAHRFLTQLPDGYQTRLGERGAGLSGGQAQRLAIARAFLKNARLLILDEPSSALDPESERHVRAALEELAERCTVVLIAHRLNAVRTADQIIVLRAGEVVECGSHSELLTHYGFYSELMGSEARLVAAG